MDMSDGEGFLAAGPAPELVPITDAAGARRTIERIVEQGEGARGDWATAHDGRFLAVLEEYRGVREEDATFDPAHPAVAAGVRGVEGVDPDVFIGDPVTAAVSDLFNAVYDVLLQMIARYFAFGHETAEQRRILADATDGIQADPGGVKVLDAVATGLRQMSAQFADQIEAV
jgi:hypothetical protein